MSPRALSAPLLLYALSLLGRASTETTLAVIGCAEIFVVTGLFGGLSIDGSRWGWFGFSVAALSLVFLILFGNMSKSAFRKGRCTGFAFLSLCFFIVGTWSIYPVVWVIGEGTTSVSVNVEILLYAILDVITRGFFGLAILLSEPVAMLYLDHNIEADAKM